VDVVSVGSDGGPPQERPGGEEVRARGRRKQYF
jgi:hypothetical protein